MSRIEELEAKFGKGHRELYFPCEGGDGALRITWEDDDIANNPEWRMLWIEHVSWPDSLWRRIKNAWTLLLGRPVDTTWVGLDKITTDSLRNFLNEVDEKEVVKPVTVSSVRKANVMDVIYNINNYHKPIPGQQELPFGNEEALVGEVHND